MNKITVDEMREKIRAHCKARSEVIEHCEGCPAVDLPKKGCYESVVPDSTVKRVYKVLVKKGEL